MSTATSRDLNPVAGEDATRPEFWNRSGFTFALLVLSTLAVYLPALAAGFIWDDDILLTHNPLIPAPNGLRLIWFSTLFGDFVPLTLTSYWIEYRLWGFSPAGYHAVNIALHALSSFLLWRLLSRLHVPGAFMAALIFAVHPVNVESVAWIAQRKNTLSLLFYVASLLCFERFDELSPRQAARRHPRGPVRPLAAGSGLWYGLSLGAFLLSLLSKTAGVTLPAVLLGLAWWKRGRIARRDWLRTVPFFLLAVAMSGVAIWIQHRQVLLGIERTAGLPSRIAGAGWAAWFYAAKALWPLKLSFVYPRWEINPASLLAWAPNLAWLLCAVLAWRFRKTWGKPMLFAFGYYLLTLLPVLGLLHIYYFRYSPVADHYQYFSIIGPVALAAAFAHRLLARKLVFLGIPLVALLGGLTWQQVLAYRSPKTLWQHTLAANPAAWLAHSNLGHEQLSAGKFEEAIAHFQAAQRVEPNAPEVENNWGQALVWLGNLSEAEGHFRTALRLNPQFGNAHFNYANLLFRTGRVQQALEHYQAALQALVRDHSIDTQLHNNFGAALAQSGKLEAAVAHFQTSLQIEPNYDAWDNLARVRLDQGKPDEAIKCFQASLQLTNTAQIHYELGRALSAQGKVAEAVRHYQQSLQINPDLASARYALGLLFLKQHNPAGALPHFRQALQSEPGSAELLNNLAWVLATCPDGKLRNGPEAVSLAERACALSKAASSSYLDTLAAAYAETGNFDAAIVTVQKALALADQMGAKDNVEPLRQRLELYRARRPYHEGR